MKISNLLLSMLTLTSLAACGGSQDPDTVNFMLYSPDSIEHKAAFQNLINDFTAQTNIKVKLNMVSKDKYEQTLPTALTKGIDAPDIMYMDQQTVYKFAEEDFGIEDITSLLEGTSIDLNKFNQAVLDTNYYHGKLYGLPLNMTSSVLFYNKDLVSESQLPKTWDDWKNITVPAQKALFEGIGTEGYAGWYFQAFSKNCGGELYDETSGKCTFNTPENREAAQFIKDIYRNSSDKTIRTDQNAFAKGKILFKVGSSFDVDNLRSQNPAFKTKLGAILMPNKQGETHYSVMGGENLAIAKKSTKKDKAMKLMEFLLSKESSTLLSTFTGNFPAITEYATTDDPVKQVILDQLKTVVARPKVTKWTAINKQYLGKALDDILSPESPKDIEERLTWAETQANMELGK